LKVKAPRFGDFAEVVRRDGRIWRDRPKRNKLLVETSREEAGMTRSPQETFEHHARALFAGDIDELVADYTDDAVFITPRGVHRGKNGVRAAFTDLFVDLPHAKWDAPTLICEGDVMFMEWTAASVLTRAMDGITTFVFADDGIRAQPSDTPSRRSNRRPTCGVARREYR
jgi:hypothetical protein